MSNASPASAKPAFANFVEFSTKFTASPVFCPAEIASYTLLAISLELMPVWFDRLRIALSRSPNGTWDKSAMVLTFAIASSREKVLQPGLKDLSLSVFCYP